MAVQPIDLVHAPAVAALGERRLGIVGARQTRRGARALAVAAGYDVAMPARSRSADSRSPPNGFPDYLMPERQIVTDIAVQRGGGYALQIDYVMEHVKAGLVPLAESLASSCPSGVKPPEQSLTK